MEQHASRPVDQRIPQTFRGEATKEAPAGGGPAAGAAAPERLDAAGSSDLDTALEVTKSAIFFILDEGVPFVGPFLAFGFSTLWDVLLRPGTDVWEQLRSRIENLVDQKIGDYHYKLCRDKVKGFSDAAQTYRRFALQKEKDWAQIAIQATALQQSIVAALPLFQEEDYALPLTPLFVQVANLHLSLLHDLAAYGEQMGLQRSSVDQYRSMLDEVVSPHGDRSYVRWVTDQYQAGRSKLPRDTQHWLGDAKNAAKLIGYDRNFWLQSMDYATYLWPKLHSDPVPTDRFTDRTVYLGPFGSADWDWYDGFQVPGPAPRGLFSGLEVWSWDRVDQMDRAFGWPEKQWTGRVGNPGGSSDPDEKDHGAGGTWSFTSEDYMTKVTVQAGQGVYSFRFTTNTGWSSHQCGRDIGGDGPLYCVTDFGIANHQVVDVQPHGANGGYTNMDALMVAFRPVTEQVGHGFPLGVDAVVPLGDRGYWFFRGDKALRTDKAGTGIEVPVGRLTDPRFWPGLADTAFAGGCDTVYRTPEGGWRFFKGNLVLETDGAGELRTGPVDFAGAAYWPALAGTAFASGIDAVYGKDDGTCWFFKDGDCAHVSADGRRLLFADRIIHEEGWPGLTGTVCETGVDAVYLGGDGFWLFRADQCLKTDFSGRLWYEPGALTAEGRWPVLLDCGVNLTT